jgi:predicted DNA-binding transcriptional regulator AlpA
MTEPAAFLGIRASAMRLQRSRHTIYRWMAEGLPHQVESGRMYVLEEDLLTWWRMKMIAQRQSRFVDGGHRVRACA